MLELIVGINSAGGTGLIRKLNISNIWHYSCLNRANVVVLVHLNISLSLFEILELIDLLFKYLETTAGYNVLMVEYSAVWIEVLEIDCIILKELNVVDRWGPLLSGVIATIMMLREALMVKDGASVRLATYLLAFIEVDVTI